MADDIISFMQHIFCNRISAYDLNLLLKSKPDSNDVLILIYLVIEYLLFTYDAFISCLLTRECKMA